LSGNIPNFNLPNLVTLNLYYNQLSGNIPNFNLPNLRTLALFSNQLTGNIPNFNLPNLQVLSLGYNQLNGNIPNFNLPNLRSLELFSNQLTGSIPNFNLPKLLYLQLDSNQLSGCIPESIKINCPLIGAAGGNVSSNPNLATQSWANYWNSGQGVCGRTNVSDINTDNIQLALYPNPTKEDVTIKLVVNTTGIYSITVTDALNQTNLRLNSVLEKGENIQTLQTAQWVKGLYWVKVSNGHQTIMKKLIVQ
jgi:hypothetical protein